MSAAKKLRVEDIQFLTIKDVCKKTTYSRPSIDKFIRDGVLKAEKLNNGKRVIEHQSFLEFLEKIKE